MRVLIVVDMQNDFITGPLGSEDAQAIIPNILEKMNAYFSSDYYVLCTMDTHFSDYLDSVEGKHLPIEHCIWSSEGWKLENSINTLVINHPNNSDTVTKEAFGAISLVDILDKDIESIELCGVCTDICVISNAILVKSILPNVPIIVDASCCAGSRPEAHKKALELMKNSLHIDVINWEK